MKLLLDEDIPHPLRQEIVGHDVYTVRYLGWAGCRNGELLRRAADAGFDALITCDRNLEYQQNLATLPCSVVVLLARPATLETLTLLIPALLRALERLAPRTLVRVT